MVFDEITLHNFGAYYGKHTIKLTPKSPKRPIILIGGYNGAGKTTLFDAFQLVLFGKLANSTSRDNLPYEKYLKQSINKNVPQREGAKISLIFRHKTDRTENTYQVNRSWFSNGKGTKETVEVFTNGSYDSVMSESWSEIIEDYIPLEISKLFFFDGEKIKELAEQKKTSQIISTGIYSLLGLNLVDKLHADLNVLKRKKAIPTKNEDQQDKINAIQSEITALDQKRNIRKIKYTVVENEIKDLKEQLRQQESLFKNAGGDCFQSRHKLQEEKLTIEAGATELKKRMLELAASPLPMILTKKLLLDIKKQDDKEFECGNAKILVQTLQKRDSDLIKYISKKSVEKDFAADIEKYLSKERKKLKKNTKTKTYHKFSEKTRTALNNLNETILPNLQEQLKAFSEKYDLLNSKLLTINRKLEMVPEKESIVEYISNIEKIKISLKNKEKEFDRLIEEYQQTCVQHEARQKALTKEIEKTIELKLENESNKRIIEYSGKVQKSVIEFKKAMIQNHIGRIQKYIEESISQLFRKKNFIESFKIDADTFAFKMIGKHKKTIQLQQLSAGEKQLLITSILWGLAKASNFPLPAIIDTPLGRLDSKHRNKIVEGYFPLASHQVLLLSTDEEISKGYINKLKPWISHSYILQYQNKTETTSVETGYFKEAL